LVREANIFITGGSVWLKQWSEINSKYGGNPNVGKYIGIYFAFGIGSAGLVVLQTLILWIFCSIEVSLPYRRACIASDVSARMHDIAGRPAAAAWAIADPGLG